MLVAYPYFAIKDWRQRVGANNLISELQEKGAESLIAENHTAIQEAKDLLAGQLDLYVHAEPAYEAVKLQRDETTFHALCYNFLRETNFHPNIDAFAATLGEATTDIKPENLRRAALYLTFTELLDTYSTLYLKSCAGLPTNKHDAEHIKTALLQVMSGLHHEKTCDALLANYQQSLKNLVSAQKRYPYFREIAEKLMPNVEPLPFAIPSAPEGIADEDIRTFLIEYTTNLLMHGDKGTSLKQETTEYRQQRNTLVKRCGEEYVDALETSCCRDIKAALMEKKTNKTLVR